MALTAYVFDALQQVRMVLLNGVTELIHNENEFTLDATIPLAAKVRPGEYLGFADVDGLFRLFEIDQAEDNDDAGETVVSATDAAAAALSYLVVEDLQQEDVTASAAIEKLLSGTGWSLGQDGTTDHKATTSFYYHTIWEALQEIADTYDLRIIPYYQTENGKITGRLIDVVDDVGTPTGILYEGETDAVSISITNTGAPQTVMYGLGASTSTGDESENLTFADVEWKVSDGDPVDKPKGQTWVENKKAIEQHGWKARVYLNNDIEDAEELLKETWRELLEAGEPTVSASCTLADVHNMRKTVHLGDIIRIRPKNREDLTARVIGIKRNYMEPERTKITLGTPAASLESTLANLTRGSIHTSEKITIYKNKFRADETLIQLNSEAIQLNAETILAQAERIDLVATKVDEQDGTINQVLIDMDAINATLLLKASRTEVEELETRVTSAEILLNGDDATIGLVTKVEENGEKISEAYILIDGQESKIELKADLVLLDAYVKASQLESLTLDILEYAEISRLTATSVYAELVDTLDINASYANLSNLTVDGTDVGMQSITVKTGNPTVLLNTTDFTFIDGEGNQRTIRIPTSTTVSGGTTKKIEYVGVAPA